jgi:hypothetical protein
MVHKMFLKIHFLCLSFLNSTTTDYANRKRFLRARRSILTVILLAGLFSSSVSFAGQIACTPQAPYTNCQRITYSGSTQTFTVPAGVASIRVTMWGAGGGGAASSNAGNTFSTGGASGGFAAALRIISSVVSSFCRELIGPVPLTR